MADSQRDLEKGGREFAHSQELVSNNQIDSNSSLGSVDRKERWSEILREAGIKQFDGDLDFIDDLYIGASDDPYIDPPTTPEAESFIKRNRLREIFGDNREIAEHCIRSMRPVVEQSYSTPDGHRHPDSLSLCHLFTGGDLGERSYSLKFGEARQKLREYWRKEFRSPSKHISPVTVDLGEAYVTAAITHSSGKGVLPAMGSILFGQAFFRLIGLPFQERALAKLRFREWRRVPPETPGAVATIAGGLLAAASSGPVGWIAGGALALRGLYSLGMSLSVRKEVLGLNDKLVNLCTEILDQDPLVRKNVRKFVWNRFRERYDQEQNGSVLAFTEITPFETERELSDCLSRPTVVNIWDYDVRAKEHPLLAAALRRGQLLVADGYDSCFTPKDIQERFTEDQFNLAKHIEYVRHGNVLFDQNKSDLNLTKVSCLIVLSHPSSTEEEQIKAQNYLNLIEAAGGEMGDRLRRVSRLLYEFPLPLQSVAEFQAFLACNADSQFLVVENLQYCGLITEGVSLAELPKALEAVDRSLGDNFDEQTKVGKLLNLGGRVVDVMEEEGDIARDLPLIAKFLEDYPPSARELFLAYREIALNRRLPDEVFELGVKSKNAQGLFELRKGVSRFTEEALLNQGEQKLTPFQEDLLGSILRYYDSEFATFGAFPEELERFNKTARKRKGDPVAGRHNPLQFSVKSLDNTEQYEYPKAVAEAVTTLFHPLECGAKQGSIDLLMEGRASLMVAIRDRIDRLSDQLEKNLPDFAKDKIEEEKTGLGELLKRIDQTANASYAV